MTDQRVTLVNHDLGKIKMIPSSAEFPWEVFVGGEINCAYNITVCDPREAPDGANINDVRLWVNKNLKGTVFLTHSRWSQTRIAFNNDEDAVAFQLKFGDYLHRLNK